MNFCEEKWTIHKIYEALASASRETSRKNIESLAFPQYVDRTCHKLWRDLATLCGKTLPHIVEGLTERLLHANAYRSEG